MKVQVNTQNGAISCVHTMPDQKYILFLFFQHKLAECYQVVIILVVVGGAQGFLCLPTYYINSPINKINLPHENCIIYAQRSILIIL